MDYQLPPLPVAEPTKQLTAQVAAKPGDRVEYYRSTGLRSRLYRGVVERVTVYFTPTGTSVTYLVNAGPRDQYATVHRKHQVPANDVSYVF